MKYINRFFILITVVACITFIGCETRDYGVDFQVPTAPVVEAVVGPDTVDAGTKHSFAISAPRLTSTYNWNVSGATAASLEGSSISVTFDAGAPYGNVSISATETNSAGQTGDAVTVSVAIKTIEPGVAASLDVGTPIKDGGSDIVRMVFDKPIASAPSIAVLSGGGDFGDVFPVDTTDAEDDFYAIYTHDDGGDGMVKFEVSGAIASEAFGGETMDATSFEIITIDNTAPIGAIAANGNTKEFVQPGTTILLNVEFKEPLQKSYLVGTISGTDIVSFTDTLFAADDDNTVFEIAYTPELAGGATSIDVSLDLAFAQGADLAGNDAVYDAVLVQVDNILPAIGTVGASSINAGIMTLSGTMDEGGSIKYLIRTKAFDEDSETDPPVASDFTESFTAGGSTVVQFLETDTYNIYYLPEDFAGNQGAIVKISDINVL